MSLLCNDYNGGRHVGFLDRFLATIKSQDTLIYCVDKYILSLQFLSASS